MTDNIVIKTENLNKSFKIDFWKETNHVLKDVSFKVGKGEIYGFLGHNGAGKTTTIKILNNLISKDSGTVELWNKQPESIDIKKRIGYLPENPSFYNHLTGKEFLQFYSALHKLKKSEAKNKIDLLLKKIGLDNHSHLKLKKYSKGMIQRIGLAQALLNDPDLLILDEPMSGLDPIGRYEIRDIILEEREKGKTIFFSSHLLSDVEIICDFVTIMVQGRVVSSGRIEDLVSKEIESWDVTVSLSKLPKSFSKLNILHTHGEDHIIRLTKETEIEPLIKNVYKSKGKVKGVLPIRKTLEELFVAEMKKGVQ